MYALNQLKKKETDDHSVSTRYTPLSTSDNDNVNVKTVNPPRWNTPEFYLYYLVFIICIPWMFKIAIDLSKETHPNYPKYSARLSKGWLFGRKMDNSDDQFKGFRGNYLILAIVLCVYLLLSHLHRTCVVPKPPAKLPRQRVPRTYFFLFFSSLYLYVLHGNGLLKILIILTINYGISKLFKGSMTNVILTWIFNVGILILNDKYDGYEFGALDRRLAFLDKNGGIMRWFISFNLCTLRLISYNMDYYWSFHNSETTERDDRDYAPLSIKDRINNSCFREDYNYIYYLSYILYTPLYLAGPILTYNNYISQLRYPHKINIKSTLSYGLRLFGAILFMEFMLHYIYVIAISKSRAWTGDTPAQLSMIGYFNLTLIWLKLLIIWRFFRFWAMADGIEVQENMTRCMNNNYSAQGFWRSWHRSFNLWNIRYIYIPLGGSNRATINMLIVFVFVAIWHDVSFKLLAWGGLIWLFIMPEKIGRMIFSSKKWVEWPYYRHLCAAGCVFNNLMMTFANLVGFSVGLDGLKDLLSEIFLTINGVIFLAMSYCIIFVGIQVMFEIREEEARRNIRSDGRN